MRLPWQQGPERQFDPNNPLGRPGPEHPPVDPRDPFGRRRPERQFDPNNPLGRPGPERRVDPRNPLGKQGSEHPERPTTPVKPTRHRLLRLR